MPAQQLPRTSPYPQALGTVVPLRAYPMGGQPTSGASASFPGLRVFPGLKNGRLKPGKGTSALEEAHG